MNFNHLTCNFIRISFGSYLNLIRILLESYSNKYFYVKSFASIYEIFRKFM